MMFQHHLPTALLLTLLLAAAAQANAEIHVSPDGDAEGDGSATSPLDLHTAMSRPDLVTPGTTVWLMAGRYEGPFENREVSGTPDAPIVFRARPGARVTLSAGPDDHAVIETHADHVWYWGFEITCGDSTPPERGTAISIKGGRDIKFINLIIHHNKNRSGIGGTARGMEIYGCIIYRNGLSDNHYSHGIYTQNRPSDWNDDIAAMPWAVYRDSIVANNYGWGMHSYATAPRLAKMRYEGIISYGNGCLPGTPRPMVNFLSGGQQYDDLHHLSQCYTYFPPEGNFKRGVDLGYGGDNGRLTVENSTFIGGHDALWLRQWEQITFVNNRVGSSNGSAVTLTTPERGRSPDYTFARNHYLHLPANLNAFDRDADFTPVLNQAAALRVDGRNVTTLETWRRLTGAEEDGSHITQELPREPWIAVRPNAYEPNQAFLATYNWPHTDTVSVDIAQHWPTVKEGQVIHAYDAEKVFGEPIATAPVRNGSITLPVAGPYAPAFICYQLRLDGDRTSQ